ncbi:MAG: hypothetical protein ACK40I_03615 [Tabrizicola sp.]
MNRRPIRIPNLGGAQAIIPHCPHPMVQALTRQLTAIGLQLTLAWPELGAEALAADYFFFDADLGHDAMFPWKAGRAPARVVLRDVGGGHLVGSAA